MNLWKKEKRFICSKMKGLLFLIIMKPCWTFSQQDTLIDSVKYEIIKRYGNGKVKYAGQHTNPCCPNKKSGNYLSFNKQGKMIKEKYYCCNILWNRKFLGLKHGYWNGCGGGMSTKYFLGKKRHSSIGEPCF